MGYVLNGVIGRADILVTAAGQFSSARPVSLAQGFALVPMTAALFDEAARAGSGTSLGFELFPPGFDAVLRVWSAEAPVAYVEADYFGGVGEQRAAVWSAARLALGPVAAKSDQPRPDGTPISQALRALGAIRTDDGDEFDAVGLSAHRDTDDWT